MTYNSIEVTIKYSSIARLNQVKLHFKKIKILAQVKVQTPMIENTMYLYNCTDMTCQIEV